MTDIVCACNMIPWFPLGLVAYTFGVFIVGHLLGLWVGVDIERNSKRRGRLNGKQ